MARLFADENFPFPVVEALRRVGHDVTTVADAGKAGQALTDKAILAVFTADQRAVVTLNRRHFVRLHAAEPNHAGIISVRSIRTPTGRRRMSTRRSRGGSQWLPS